MSVPTFGQKHLIIVGASGMVGGYALRDALDSPVVKSVTSIGRKKLGSYPESIQRSGAVHPGPPAVQIALSIVVPEVHNKSF